jgi:hypothetical protein
MKMPTTEELEKAIDDIGYAILQACVAQELYHIEIVPVLRRSGISAETIHIVNNASLEEESPLQAEFMRLGQIYRVAILTVVSLLKQGST